MPDVAALEQYQPSLVTEVYDRHEQLIAEFFVEKRRLVHLTEIPMHVRHATIAAAKTAASTPTAVWISSVSDAPSG